MAILTNNFEENLSANYLLENYFYKDYRSEYPINSLEVIFSPKCNLQCSYCYLNKHYSETFPDDIYDVEKSLKNMELILMWMKKNNFRCPIEIFSGEVFSQEGGYKLLELIYRFLKENPELKPKYISIPSNFTFLCSDELTQKVQKFIDDFKSIGISLHLSASVDGKYMETNRKVLKNLDLDLNIIRDDTYYDKLFTFIKKNDCGIHPMIYSKNIENWKKNFLWFQDEMEKHGIPWKWMYLLQVRNKEWTNEQNKQLYDFITFLFEYCFEKLNKDKEKMLDYLLNEFNGGFNILPMPLKMINRGVSCSIQNALPIRLSDLKVYPCHRLMYKQLEEGHFEYDEEEILSFKVNNLSLFTTVYGCKKESFPICSACPMNKLCMGGCLGSQYETNRSLFVPIPTVCKNYFYTVKALIDCLVKYDMFFRVTKQLPIEVSQQLNFLRKYKIDEE